MSPALLMRFMRGDVRDHAEKHRSRSVASKSNPARFLISFDFRLFQHITRSRALLRQCEQCPLSLQERPKNYVAAK